MDILRGILNTGWVSSSIGLIGLLVAIVLYRASVIGARPVYQRRCLRLIGKNEQALPNDVEIRFKGQVVERLTKNYVVFGNAGKKLLRGADIVSEDRVRCEFSDDARILDARVVAVTKATNKFTVGWPSDRPHSIDVMFDYLDPCDGAVIEILHTDTKAYPDVRGTIRGVPSGCLDWGQIRKHSPARGSPFKNRHIMYLCFLIGILVLAISIWLPESALENPGASASFLRRAMAGTGVFYAALPLAYYWVARRRYPKGLQVQELEE